MLKQIIGANVREIRTSGKTQFSQEELADRVPIQTAHLGRIERGKWNPTLMTLFRIENALEVPRFVLFDENYGKSKAEPCFGTLNRFIRCNVHRRDDTPDTRPSKLLFETGVTLLERITVEEIERDAEKYLKQVLIDVRKA